MLSCFKKQNLGKSGSKNKLRKHFKKEVPIDCIEKIYQFYVGAVSKNNEKKHLLKIIDLCYNNIENQIKLAQLLHLPFLGGPISLHQFPSVLLEQNQTIGNKNEGGEQQQTQLQFLFNFLKNVKEYYYCWIIYFNEDLKILNIKLLKKGQVHEHQDMFNPSINLVGIFINKGKDSKQYRQKNMAQEYYSSNNQKTLNDKSISTFNNSTGVTWKLKAGEQFKQKNKTNSINIRSISPKITLEEPHKQRNFKKQDKSHSTNCLKEKSKSQILLSRSKSNNIREILLGPIKTIVSPSNLKSKQKNSKTKLKKQSKISKIQSIYFKQNDKQYYFP